MEKFEEDATKIDLDRNSGKLWQPRGGCFQISISICPRRCFTDSSRDNDTTTINDSSRIVSRWTPDIFDAKPPWNTPSNIYIVIHTITSYLSLSKPINERYFPGRKCESITKTKLQDRLNHLLCRKSERYTNVDKVSDSFVYRTLC